MLRPRPEGSRRGVLGGIVGLAGAAFIPQGTAHAAAGLSKVADLVGSSLGIDMHNHVDVRMADGETPPAGDGLAVQMKRSGLSAICMTFAVDYVPLVRPGQPFERFERALSEMDAILERNGMRRALNLADLRAAHAAGRPTVVQAVEGGHFLEGRLERLEGAYARGLRHLGLLHDSDASTPLGDVYTNPARFGGLTDFGVEVVRECNRLGMVIDLAHATAETTLAAIRISKHPVIISHTGLDTQLGANPDLARKTRPRLISKHQARTVAAAGGVIGVWTHLADTPDAYARNVRALVDIVGVDHVGIGTDTKLTPAIDSRRPSDRPGDRTNAAWPGETRGFYFTVVQALLAQGFTAEEMGRIGGGNFCRVFGQATSR